MIVTTGSPLEGRSVRQERLAERFGFVVVGVRTTAQRATWQREGLTDRLVRVGDVLLVQGDAAAMRKAQRDGLGLLLDERFAVARQDKAGIAILVMAAVVVLAASKTLPIEIAALSGALVLLLTRCLSWDDITQSLSAKVILLVAASLALGDGLSLTGATDWLAQGLATQAGALSAAWLVALLMGLMGLVTNFVSNNAAAAIGTPLAVSLAQALDTPAEPLVLAVLFGCNLCYLTPMGYQTNLLVMNAGGYRFSDFLRVGTPLFLIMWSALSFLLAWRYGLL
jgi:di/tricarboxylate transporter